MKIHQIEDLILTNGDIKLSELLLKVKGDLKHKCPKCNGIGSTFTKYNAYPKNLPDSGFVEDWKNKEKRCDICNGIGYTKDEFMPIIETKITGYKKL